MTTTTPTKLQIDILASLPPESMPGKPDYGANLPELADDLLGNHCPVSIGTIKREIQDLIGRGWVTMVLDPGANFGRKTTYCIRRECVHQVRTMLALWTPEEV